jgi:hypothetical protein
MIGFGQSDGNSSGVPLLTSAIIRILHAGLLTGPARKRDGGGHNPSPQSAEGNMEGQPITAGYLRQRAVHYRKLVMRAANSRTAARYRDISEIFDEAADSLERSECRSTRSAGTGTYTRHEIRFRQAQSRERG